MACWTLARVALGDEGMIVDHPRDRDGAPRPRAWRHRPSPGRSTAAAHRGGKPTSDAACQVEPRGVPSGLAPERAGRGRGVDAGEFDSGHGGESLTRSRAGVPALVAPGGRRLRQRRRKSTRGGRSRPRPGRAGQGGRSVAVVLGGTSTASVIRCPPASSRTRQDRTACAGWRSPRSRHGREPARRADVGSPGSAGASPPTTRVHPLADASERIVVERRHLPGVDRAVGQQAVPAFPHGRRSHEHRVQPRRSTGLGHQSIRGRAVTAVAQCREDCRRAEESSGDLVPPLGDAARQSSSDPLVLAGSSIIPNSSASE